MLKYSYTFRAKVEKKDEFRNFTLADGLCMYSKNRLMLQGVEVSPLLRKGTFLRGDETGKYFEGDKVVTEDKEGYVIYTRIGFCAKFGTEVIPMSDLINYTIKAILPSEKPEELKYLGVLRFKCNGSLFDSSRLLGKIDGALLIGYDGWHSIDPMEVKQSTGLYAGEVPLYFGDEVDGGILSLNKGRISIYKDNAYEIVQITEPSSNVRCYEAVTVVE